MLKVFFAATTIAMVSYAHAGTTNSHKLITATAICEADVVEINLFSATENQFKTTISGESGIFFETVTYSPRADIDVIEVAMGHAHFFEAAGEITQFQMIDADVHNEISFANQTCENGVVTVQIHDQMTRAGFEIGVLGAIELATVAAQGRATWANDSVIEVKQ